MASLLSVFLSVSCCRSCQWCCVAFLWTGRHDVHSPMSSPASELLHALCISCFHFLLRLPASSALPSNVWNNKAHYYSWFFSSTNWEGLLPPAHLMLLVWVQSLHLLSCGQNSELPVRKLWEVYLLKTNKQLFEALNLKQSCGCGRDSTFYVLLHRSGVFVNHMAGFQDVAFQSTCSKSPEDVDSGSDVALTSSGTFFEFCFHL